MLKDGSSQVRGGRIEQRPNLSVTGNLEEAKERVGITGPLVNAHSALIDQARRALGEKHSKGAQSGIAHGGVFVLPFANIRQRRRPQRVQKIRERRRFAHGGPLARQESPVVFPSTPRKAIGIMRIAGIYAREGVSHIWLADPLQRTLEIYRLEGQHWLLINTHEESDLVRAEPFATLELDLSRWWLEV